jgi:hypothetical protein
MQYSRLVGVNLVPLQLPLDFGTAHVIGQSEGGERGDLWHARITHHPRCSSATAPPHHEPPALTHPCACAWSRARTLQDTAAQQEAQLRELAGEAESRGAEAARLREQASSALTEAGTASGRVRLLESQLQVRG